jgi:nucleotide-binding universal stress UspA family protein
MRLELTESPSTADPSKGRVEETMTAKRILVPLDGSESAETAVAVAADLARSSGGSVRLLRVSPVPKQWVGNYGRVVAYADQEMERLTAEGRDYLETVGAQVPAVPIESVVRFGEPAEEILVEAEAFGADAIVLATGRLSWLKRVTGGGVGQSVVLKAPVTVVLVRAA